MSLEVGGKLKCYFCKYCERDITSTLRIRCAECMPEMDFCGDCFAVGVEIDDHKATHDYYVSDCLDFPIFTNDWTVSEELLLLEGLKHLFHSCFIILCIFSSAPKIFVSYSFNSSVM